VEGGAVGAFQLGEHVQIDMNIVGAQGDPAWVGFSDSPPERADAMVEDIHEVPGAGVFYTARFTSGPLAGKTGIFRPDQLQRLPSNP